MVYEVCIFCCFFFFKQKTAYEIWRDWSSDVCSSDLVLFLACDSDRSTTKSSLRWREMGLTCHLGHEEDRQRRQGEPDGDHNDGCHPVCRLLFVRSTPCLFAALGQDGFRDHAYRQGYAEGDQEQVIQVPEYGDRVGDQVYGAESIPDHD